MVAERAPSFQRGVVFREVTSGAMSERGDYLLWSVPPLLREPLLLPFLLHLSLWKLPREATWGSSTSTAAV
jgi:hypothetical protein